MKNEEVVKRVKMIPAHSPAEAWQLASQILGHYSESVYIMPHGGNTFPIMRELQAVKPVRQQN